jgi:hypothetical protein
MTYLDMKGVEVWKDAPDILKGANLSDYYKVSDHGRIISKAYLKYGRNIHGSFSYLVPEKFPKIGESADGYYQLHFSRKDSDAPKTTVKVHRMVAAAFKPDSYDETKQVNHIDGNKKNNHISNLEWVSARDNVIHSYLTGLADNSCEKHPRSLLSNREVIEARSMYDNGCKVSAIASYFGIKYHTMWKLVKRVNFKGGLL